MPDPDRPVTTRQGMDLDTMIRMGGRGVMPAESGIPLRTDGPRVQNANGGYTPFLRSMRTESEEDLDNGHTDDHSKGRRIDKRCSPWIENDTDITSITETYSRVLDVPNDAIQMFLSSALPTVGTINRTKLKYMGLQTSVLLQPTPSRFQ